MKKGVENLTFPLNGNFLAMLAPSFVVDYSYPKIIFQLKNLGFDKVVELTFGAKMINREYHKILEKTKDLVISSVCPGIVETIKSKYPNYKKNLISVDSPMIATAKICRKVYPKYKIVFISPCNFKKIEAEKSDCIDYVIDYNELGIIISKYDKSKMNNSGETFDKFYNDYTKIYPLSGGLSETANLKNILRKDETKIIDGVNEVIKFLDKPDPKIRFLDVTFCKGGCIGGPCVNSKLPLVLKKKRVLDYLKLANKECIPENSKGLVNEAKGISFKSEYPNK
jgi:iron only hydrogenase large subunit-like protein